MGRSLTPGALWDALRSDPEFDCHIIQERIRNHHLLAQLGGGDETLDTLRIVTLIDRDGSAQVLWATVKLGISGSGVDNIAHGTTGNISCILDLEDGRVGGVLTPRASGYGQALSAPPADGRGLPYHVPFWEEACALACEGAAHFRPLRTLGWDIAIASDGPVIIEANANWGMEPSARMGAVLARMRVAGGVAPCVGGDRDGTLPSHDREADMKVRDAMAAGVRSVGPGQSIAQAARVMSESGTGFLPVGHYADRPVGVVTDRDIVVRFLAGGGGDAAATPVSEVMTSKVATVGPDDDPAAAAEAMRDGGVRRLVVIDAAGVAAGLQATLGVTRGA